MCKKPGQCGGPAFSRGIQRVSRAAAVEGSEFAPLFLRPESVLTPLSDTEALTSQYRSLCGEALSGGCSEEILHVSGDPCQWHHQFKRRQWGKSRLINKMWLFHRDGLAACQTA